LYAKALGFDYFFVHFIDGRYQNQIDQTPPATAGGNQGIMPEDEAMNGQQSNKSGLEPPLRQTKAKLESELSYMQLRNRMLLELSSDMVFIVDRNEKFIFINPGAAEILGAAPEKIMGRTFTDFLPPDMAHHHSKRIRQVLQTGNVLSDDPPFLLPPKQLWVEGQLFPMKQKDGAVVSVLGVLRDVTERKLVENALKESEARFRQIVQQMPYPVIVCSPEGMAILVNAAFLEMFPVTSDDAIVRKMDIFKMPLTSGLGIATEIKKAFAGATVFIPDLAIPLDRTTWPYRSLGTGDLSLELTVFPVYLRPGDIFQVVFIMKDISDRKRNEQALWESEQKLRTQYKSFPLPTYTWQNAGNDFVFIDYNDAAEEFTRGGVSHLLGKKLSESFFDQPGVMEDVTRCMREKTKIKKQTQFLFPLSKAEKLLQITYVFVEPDLVMVHTEDITEKQKMEEEIRKAEHLESLGLLAAGIAHDFNNLLAGIFGYVGLAREIGGSNAQVKDCLDKAMVVFGQAKSLTQQLLTFAKGGSPVRRLASISELLTDLSSFVLSGANVKPDLSLPADLWACEVDAGQLSEVFNNILINAQQAMPDGGTIFIAAENARVKEGREIPCKGGNYVRISIRDTGIGIPRKHLDRIFDPFFTTKKRGSGLGLAIAYSIIKKHEGHIGISSEQGKGTQVVVHLPASCASAGTMKQESAGFPKGQGNVLIMDDETFVLDAMCGIIKSFGYTVSSVSDGKEAVISYEGAQKAGTPFDVVILDLTIPGGFGGKQVLARLREYEPMVKAIATSGYCDDPVMSEPGEFGFKAALRKPYTIDELGKMLSEVISGK
jgi:PAS domain S-box-containing protein